MRVVKAALAIAIVLVVLAAGADGAPRDYVGVDACASCHPAIAASWRETAHARASAPEVLGRRARDGACLVCHATGEGASPARLLAGVQCEACHGGGAAYAIEDVMRDPPLSRALGLRDPMKTCARCHVARTGARPFDAAAAWERIKH